MNLRTAALKSLVVLPITALALASRAEEEPRVIDPGPPPADAIVLFGGAGLSQWRGEGGGNAAWEVKDGVATVNGTGNIATRQSYEVIFHAPRFDEHGALLKAGTLTVLHHGVLVQDHVQIQGPTARQPAKYEPHPLKQPLVLQDHGNPIRFRNIWIREL
jgi:hypothetical protein